MFLKKIDLFNFKSYEEVNFEWSKKLNLIVGLNGSGKTNILESIYFSCITKSFSGLSDQQLIKHNEQLFVVKLIIDNDSVTASCKEGGRKNIIVNKQPYEKNAEHIGRFPVIFVSPNDHDYIRDSSETRRKFLDELFCQVNSEYLTHLVLYNKILKQRNQLLKQFKDRQYFDKDLLEVFDKQIEPHGIFIAGFRENAIKELTPLVQKYYKLLSDDKEQINLTHLSQVYDSENYASGIIARHDKDRLSCRSNFGIHKDDYEFSIEQLPIKKYGSQGQQKSFMLATQLAKHQYLKDKTEKTPLLLLDDVFDKLDTKRITELMSIISSDEFGQVFITDASKDRTIEITKELDIDYQIIEIQGSQIV